MVSLFEGYLIGMMSGLFGSLKDRRFLGLCLFYMTVISSAHVYLLMIHTPSELGPVFYILAGFCQCLIGFSALALWTKASPIIALTAYVAVALNLLRIANYGTHDWTWDIYYASINTIQTIQIVSLALLNPVVNYLLRLARGKITIKKNGEVWMQSRSGT